MKVAFLNPAASMNLEAVPIVWDMKLALEAALPKNLSTIGIVPT